MFSNARDNKDDKFILKLNFTNWQFHHLSLLNYFITGTLLVEMTDIILHILNTNKDYLYVMKYKNSSDYYNYYTIKSNVGSNHMTRKPLCGKKSRHNLHFTNIIIYLVKSTLPEMNGISQYIS